MAQRPSNPSLEQLHVLVGTWTIESPLAPGVAGRAAFEWLEGGAFLIQHTEIDHPSAPNSTWIIGRDDSAGTYCMLYHDSRGVSRVYHTSLGDGVWKIWGQAGPEFFQRFQGTFGDDGKTIRAYWEKSSDGVEWGHDFDLTYSKIL
jgi:hypothetical protein